MKDNISPKLRKIIADTQAETEADWTHHSAKRVRQMQHDAPPVLSFRNAIAARPCLIAEIKDQSPSQGTMRRANVKEAPSAYAHCPAVCAVSVLTNRTHFGPGMTLERFLKLKQQVGKPVLRKDFIVDARQIQLARAYGADAILLMANILTAEEMKHLSDVAFDLGMEVLFETHKPSELAELPGKARVIGINCRNFDSRGGFGFSRFMRQWLGSKTDHSTNLSRFEYVNEVSVSHPEAVKIAESGVSTSNCAAVFALGFNAILVGTSLLMDQRGIEAGLTDFERAIRAVPPRKDQVNRSELAPS